MDWKTQESPRGGYKGWPITKTLMDMSVRMSGSHLWQQEAQGVYSLGSMPSVITSDPDVTRDFLSSPHFADRTLKKSAQ